MFSIHQEGTTQTNNTLNRAAYWPTGSVSLFMKGGGEEGKIANYIFIVLTEVL